jgi:hypothetical protein
MSEFMETHSVSKLIGSPPGYLGYNDETQLTDRVRRKPYTLILFDEIEKAHADVLNIMLQILEDGHLTDATGRTVSFKNALIIMTSNAGASADELSRFFSPEFLNRLDEIIAFKHLSRAEVVKIAELEFAKTIQRVREKGAVVTLSGAFKEKVIEQGFNAVYGARPLRRAVVSLLDDELANSLLSKPFEPGESIYVDVDSGQSVVVVRQSCAESEKSSSENEVRSYSSELSGETPADGTGEDADNEVHSLMSSVLPSNVASAVTDVSMHGDSKLTDLKVASKLTDLKIADDSESTLLASPQVAPDHRLPLPSRSLRAHVAAQSRSKEIYAIEATQ